MRRLLREKRVVHENVPDFIIAVLLRCLGDLYVITTCVLHLHALGVPGRRPRRISCLTLRDSIVVEISWSSDLAARVQRECRLTFLDFMLASEDEVPSENQWASNR